MPKLSRSVIMQALDQAPKADLSAAYQRRVVGGGGRPKTLRPCPKCGEMCGTRELRYDHICKKQS